MPIDLAREVLLHFAVTKCDNFQLFHRSETCPSCRNKTTTRNVLRIFLNLLSSEGNTQDPVVLQCKVDNLEFQMKLKEKQLEVKAKSCAKYKEQLRGLR